MGRVFIGNPPITDDPYECVDLTENAKEEALEDGGQSETSNLVGHKASVKESDSQQNSESKKATKSTAFSSQSGDARAFSRAVNSSPEMHAIYKFLGNSEKQRFRDSWIKERDWEFVKNTKRSEQKSDRSSDETGSYFTTTQIAAKYGSADNEACVAQATAYCDLCRGRGGDWILDSPEHGEMFWFSEKQYRERHTDSKSESVEMSTTENLWETRSKERKALVSFAAAAGKRSECVTLEQVRSSDLGIEGWAAAVVAPNLPTKPQQKKTARKLTDSEVDVKKAKENTAKLSRCRDAIEELKTEAQQNTNLAWTISHPYALFNLIRDTANTSHLVSSCTEQTKGIRYQRSSPLLGHVMSCWTFALDEQRRDVIHSQNPTHRF